MGLKVNPYRILLKLSEGYRRAWRDENFPISSRELEFQETLKGLIDDYISGRTVVSSDEDNVLETDFEMSPITSSELEDDQLSSESNSNPVDSQMTGSSASSFQPTQDVRIREYPNWEQVIEAVEFWRSTKPHPIKKQKSHRDIGTVKKKFGFVKNETQLYRWESKIKENDAPREWKLSQLANRVREKFLHQRSMQQPIHDWDLVRWSIEEAKGLNITDFKCSNYWLWKFKKASKISRRKITRFVSRISFEQNDNLVAQAEEFVLGVQELIREFGAENVYNMDQSGFEKCMVPRTTLAETGSSSVKVIAQSVSGLTHTYTVQPIVSASGRLVTPVTICLQEANGEFGKIVNSTMFKSPSLIYAVASKSGKMGKEQLKDWFINVMLPAGGKKFALLLDSYSAHQSLLELVPEEYNVRVLSIPPGATGMIQPLDVHGFRYWKDVARHFDKEAMTSDTGAEMYTRNSILKMQALIVNLLSSPKLNKFWQYPWSKCGYILDEVHDHISPLKVCVGDITQRCSMCNNLKCIQCPWCEKSFCFRYCFVELHLNCKE